MRWICQTLTEVTVSKRLVTCRQEVTDGSFGNVKNTAAARTAMKIHWAVKNIVNPALKKQYGDGACQMRHVIGIDSSQILAYRIGVRNDNDLVWMGRAANYAAKLSSISNGYPIYITGQVFDRSKESSKYGGVPRRLMWEERSWTAMSGIRIFRSNSTWSLETSLTDLS